MLDLLTESLDRYFMALSKTGYRRDDTVARLISLIAIHELMTRHVASYVTECDRRLLEDAAYRLFGRCVIRVPNVSREEPSLDRLGMAETSTRMTRRFVLRADAADKAASDLPCRGKDRCREKRIR